MKVVVDDKIPYLKGVLEPFMDVEYLPGAKISRDHLINADALLIRTRTICNKELLEGTSVKFIATATIGYDHIDTLYCNQHNIRWTNAPGCNSGSVMQYLAASLAWLSQKFKFEFGERTLGVIGVGNVGSKVTSLAEAIGMRVVQNDPPRERNEGVCGFISLDGLIRESDILTFHTPLNLSGDDQTLYLGNQKLFQKLNPGSFIINTSRGEVVNNQDLKSALKDGILQGSILDVWESEPTPDIELLQLADLATPHIAGYSKDGKANGTTMSIRALSRFFNLGVLDNWESEHIPLPENTVIEINCTGKSDTEIISEAVLYTYPITKDDKALRDSPSEFEKLRGDYPLRREFHVYEIILGNGNRQIQNKLLEMGFKSAIIK